MSDFIIGYNLYQNINTTRFKLYSMILDHAATERKITEQQLLGFGNFLNLSASYIQNEIIGCLYANFLVLEGKGLYSITDRAVRDFRLYSDEARYKTSEMTYTISIRENNIKIAFFTLDTIPIETISAHTKEGWSWNKSLRRLMKKQPDVKSTCCAIKSSINIFEPDLIEFDDTFENLIKTYGKKRKSYNDYSVEFNFRGKFESTTFLKYKKEYLQIKEVCKNPIDWGGKAFNVSELNEFQPQNFISDAIEDGMIRSVEDKTYSLTGHAALVINSAVYEYEKTRVSIIIRKVQNNFLVLIAENTLYPIEFKNHLAKLGFDRMDGWYRSSPFSNTQDAIDIIENILYKFTSNKRERM